MRHIVLAAGVLYWVFLQAICAQAQNTLEISGMKIPVIEGAGQVKEAARVLVKGHIATFALDKPLEETVNFYKAFLIENGFSIIGGTESGGSFNAAVKKGDAQFSLRIYRERGHTFIQFIW